MQLNPNQISTVKANEILDNIEKIQSMVNEIPDFDVAAFQERIDLLKAAIDAFANASKQAGYIEGCLAASNDFIKMGANMMQEYSKANK